MESRDHWEYQQFGACENDCFFIPNQFRIESKRSNLHSGQKNAFIFIWITIAASTAFVCVCVSRFKMKLLHGNVLQTHSESLINTWFFYKKSVFFSPNLFDSIDSIGSSICSVLFVTALFTETRFSSCLAICHSSLKYISAQFQS